ncbi:MAG: hypothetical protein E7308_06485 [Butyrivibrio sp.]|nr:hypothetical protein [Butyrivibrio sp.]
MVKSFNKKEIWQVSLLLIAFLLSLIPVFVMAKYDCASGDDFNYGAAAHLIFLETGSVIAAIEAAIGTAISIYHGWQGTWFDCFLFCLHPEVFSDEAYVIVPYIFIFMQIICYLVFAHHFLKVRWQFNGMYWVKIALLFLMFSIQLVPSQKMLAFWWVGCIHYVLPMCMALFGIVAADNFLLTYKLRYLVYLILLGTLIGGATYPAALLLPEVVLVLWLERAVVARKVDKRDALLIIPLVLEMIGLVISMKAPGNAARSAFEISHGAKPAGGIIKTIVMSIIFSVKDAATSFIGGKTFVLLAFVIIAMISWRALTDLKDNDPDKMKDVFSHPVLFLVTVFLINASMYAPRLYSGGRVSTGYLNLNFWVFFLGSISCIVYIEGWLIVQRQLQLSKKASLIVAALTFIVLCICLYAGRHGIKKYTDYVCLEYYLNGHADDYLIQMKLQRALMTQQDVTDVVVPEVNLEQGPLMQMPIVSDPTNIDNTMTAKFYGKNSCRSIPRPEWEALYGPASKWIGDE